MSSQKPPRGPTDGSSTIMRSSYDPRRAKANITHIVPAPIQTGASSYKAYRPPQRHGRHQISQSPSDSGPSTYTTNLVAPSPYKDYFTPSPCKDSFTQTSIAPHSPATTVISSRTSSDSLSLPIQGVMIHTSTSTTELGTGLFDSVWDIYDHYTTRVETEDTIEVPDSQLAILPADNYDGFRAEDKRSTLAKAESTRSRKSKRMSTLGAPGGPGPGFSPPDGGLQAWLTVTAGFIAQFCSFGFLNAMGIFHHVYQEDLLKENSASQISWILTFQFFLMFFLGQTMGVAVDMWGPKMVLIPSSIVAVTGLILLSFAKTYWQVFLAQGVVFGIGVAGIFMPGLVVTGQFFARRRGMAMGIVAAGSSVGGVVFPIFLHNMLEPHGFSNTLRYTAAMMAGLMAIACACISSPFPPKGWVARRGVVSLESFKKKEYLLFCIGAFFVFWGLFGPFDYLPQQTSQTPKLSSLSIYSIVILNGASLPGRIIPAILADKFGRFNIIIPIVFLCSISVMAMWIPLVYYPNLVGIILFAIVFGFVSGGFLSVMNPCIADLCDNIQELGTRIGGFLMVAAVASLTGLPIQGVIFDKLEGNDRFMGLITFSGVTMGIGAGFVSWAGVRVNGIIARRKREEFGLQRREV